MLGQSLQEKIAASYVCFDNLLREFAVESIFVAWTGGKDSTVLVSLWKSYLEQNGLEGKNHLQALSIDTGCKFSEVLRFRDELAAEWGVLLKVIRPNADDLAFGPDPQNPVACCRRLKIKPLQLAVEQLGVGVLMTGIRHDEHHSRQIDSWRELRQGPDYVQAHPVLHWSEMDIWAYHLQEGLPYCELYDQGFRSLGCRPCTTPGGEPAERSGRNQEKENQLHVLRSLGYF